LSEIGEVLGGSRWEAHRMLGLYSLFSYSILQPWECDKVTLPLSSHGELAGGGWSYKEAHQKLKLHSGVNS